MDAMKLWIDGKWQDASDGTTFEVLNPLDDSLYAMAAKGTEADMRDAVSAAKAAFPGFKNTTPNERETWLIKAAEIMERRKNDILDCLIDEVGSPFAKAMFEFKKGVSMTRAAAGLARQVR
ncbi:MAG TPA: aldehyde dehydrogenase, partial [Rhodobacteraceae bacterium]|nr:aldehyde dehydrogenase [Paracoccaceae bacterium]